MAWGEAEGWGPGACKWSQGQLSPRYWCNAVAEVVAGLYVRRKHRICYEFPLGVMDLARGCAETVEVLGAYTRDGFALEEAAPDVSSMSETELITAL